MLSNAQPELATHEAPKALGLPEASALQPLNPEALHPRASGPSDGQSSCSHEHRLLSPLASVGFRASCPSDSMHSSVDSRRDSSAECHADTAGVPAALPRDSPQPVYSPNSVNSSLRHSLDSVSSPPRGERDATASDRTQAAVDSHVTEGDTGSSTSSIGSSDAGEAGTVSKLEPAQLSLRSDTRQPEAELAAPLQCAHEHSSDLDSPLSPLLASQSPTSQSGSSNALAPRETVQDSLGQMGTSSSGRHSHCSSSNTAHEAQYEVHLSSGPQVCNPEQPAA